MFKSSIQVLRVLIQTERVAGLSNGEQWPIRGQYPSCGPIRGPGDWPRWWAHKLYKVSEIPSLCSGQTLRWVWRLTLLSLGYWLRLSNLEWMKKSWSDITVSQIKSSFICCLLISRLWSCGMRRVTHDAFSLSLQRDQKVSRSIRTFRPDLESSLRIWLKVGVSVLI